MRAAAATHTATRATLESGRASPTTLAILVARSSIPRGLQHRLTSRALSRSVFCVHQPYQLERVSAREDVYFARHGSARRIVRRHRAAQRRRYAILHNARHPPCGARVARLLAASASIADGGWLRERQQDIGGAGIAGRTRHGELLHGAAVGARPARQGPSMLMSERSRCGVRLRGALCFVWLSRYVLSPAAASAASALPLMYRTCPTPPSCMRITRDAHHMHHGLS